MNVLFFIFCGAREADLSSMPQEGFDNEEMTSCTKSFVLISHQIGGQADGRQRSMLIKLKACGVLYVYPMFFGILVHC